MDKFQLEKVAIPAVPFFWERLEAALLASEDFEKTLLLPENIQEDLSSGMVQLWVLLNEFREIQLVGLTRVEHYPRGAVVRIIWLHGHGARDYLAAISGLEEIARRAGITRLEIAGRPAWGRLMKDFGYGEIYRVIGKDLTKETEH